MRNKISASKKYHYCISPKLLLQLLVQLLVHYEAAALSTWRMLHPLMQVRDPAHNSSLSVGAWVNIFKHAFRLLNWRAGPKYVAHLHEIPLQAVCCSPYHIS